MPKFGIARPKQGSFLPLADGRHLGAEREVEEARGVARHRDGPDLPPDIFAAIPAEECSGEALSLFPEFPFKCVRGKKKSMFASKNAFSLAGKSDIGCPGFEYLN